MDFSPSENISQQNGATHRTVPFYFIQSRAQTGASMLNVLWCFVITCQLLLNTAFDWTTEAGIANMSCAMAASVGYFMVLVQRPV
jgi:hypothetical protein